MYKNIILILMFVFIVGCNAAQHAKQDVKGSMVGMALK